MNAILFALITFVAWGSGDIFATLGSRKTNGYAFTFWANIISMIFFSFYIPFALTDLYKITFWIFILVIILSIIFLISVVLFYQSVTIENPSLVGTITSSFVALTVLLSIVFLQEKVTFTQIGLITLIMIGIITCSIDLKLLMKNKLSMSTGVILSLLALVGYGIYYAFIKIVINQIGWFWPLYITYTLVPLLYVYMKIQKISFYSLNYKGSFKYTAIAAIVLTIGTFAFNIAIKSGLTAVVTPIAGAYPALFVVLAFIVFKEKILKQQIGGIFLTLIGIVLLSLFSA